MTFKIKYKFHWTHFVAIVTLVGYFVLSKIYTVHALMKSNIIESFLQLYLFGIFFACLFLYLFSHEKFFTFAKEIEKKEEEKEKKYLKKYTHHGKILATFIIGAIGGPVFSSLTARLLLNNYVFFKYLLVILANIPSTILIVGVSSGFINLFHL